MKNKIIALLLTINIVLIGIIYNLLNPNERLIGEKQVLKEMSTSEREQELDSKITELNASATEYATYVQSCKSQIASAITEVGVTTSETDSIDTVVENIRKLGNILVGANGSTCIFLGDTSPIDVTQFYDDYASLTVDDFYVGVNYVYTYLTIRNSTTPSSGDRSRSSTASKLYDSTTGVLTFSGPSTYHEGTGYYYGTKTDGLSAFLVIPTTT